MTEGRGDPAANPANTTISTIRRGSILQPSQSFVPELTNIFTYTSSRVAPPSLLTERTKRKGRAIREWSTSVSSAIHERPRFRNMYAEARITRVHGMVDTRVVTPKEAHFPFLCFTRHAARGVTSRGTGGWATEVDPVRRKGMIGREVNSNSGDDSDGIKIGSLFEASFLLPRRPTVRTVPLRLQTFFLPRWAIPLLPAAPWYASHYSSFALVSFAWTCRFPSMRRSFFGRADDEDDGFPVRTFLRFRASRRLPRPSADLQQFSTLSLTDRPPIRGTKG